MARNEQLIRQHKLLEILEARRYGASMTELRDELVETLGLSSLSERTVRRDLSALQAAGFDLTTSTRGGETVWKLGPHAKKKLELRVTATELLSLSLGRELLLPLAGTPFGQGIESFWKRVQSELPESVWEHYQKYRRVLRVLGIPAKSYEDHHGIIRTMNRAILEHRVVLAEYASVGKPHRERQIEPYGMALWEGSLYLIGADHDLEVDAEARVRSWKVDRFQKVTALDKWFSIPDAFDLDEFLSNSLGGFVGARVETYVVWISPLAARWVLEDPWHPTQKVEPFDDGSIQLTLEAAHPMAVIPRVMALGREAELLTPPEAREEMRRILRDSLARYEVAD